MGALEHLRDGHVTFSEISEDVLSQCVLTVPALSSTQARLAAHEGVLIGLLPRTLEARESRIWPEID